MSYVRDFMSIRRYIKSAVDVHDYGHQFPSALADLVARSGVVDLGVALLVRDDVVEADDAETLVDPLHGDGAVRAAAGKPGHRGGSQTDQDVRAHGSSLPLNAMRTRPITRECGQSGSSCPVPAHDPRQPAHLLCRTRSDRSRTR